MTTKAEQASRYWLTPAGCLATSGHKPDDDDEICRICGAPIDQPAGVNGACLTRPKDAHDRPETARGVPASAGYSTTERNETP